MTDKELKKLSRAELLELLIIQTERAEKLEYEWKAKEESYQLKIKTLEEALSDKKINAKKIGSIAEAALELNGVFEAAQKAADQYLENIKIIYQQLEKKHSEDDYE